MSEYNGVYSDELAGILKNINLDIRINLNHTERRELRNSISPSLWTLKDTKKQALKFFEPRDLFRAGLINGLQKDLMTKQLENSMDYKGYSNCMLGNVIHFIILPELVKSLTDVENGIYCFEEVPISCYNTLVKGTIDFLVVDKQQKKVHLMDLKTTGSNKILERASKVPTTYERQLYAYSRSVYELIKDKGYTIGDICVLSYNKSPGSNGIIFDKSLEEYVKVSRTDLSAEKHYTYEELNKSLSKELDKLTREVHKIHDKMVLSISGYNNWVVKKENKLKILKEL